MVQGAACSALSAYLVLARGEGRVESKSSEEREGGRHLEHHLEAGLWDS